MDAETKETDTNILVSIIAVIVGLIVIIFLVIVVCKIRKSSSRSTQGDIYYSMQGTANPNLNPNPNPNLADS